mmetsp:Transcript_30945/g.67786  ORF Transcript_30945/g.67786 Transcript_30945/m.67786 type:complete len:84 (+) Transcript_30945:528-779(+)
MRAHWPPGQIHEVWLVDRSGRMQAFGLGARLEHQGREARGEISVVLKDESDIDVSRDKLAPYCVVRERTSDFPPFYVSAEEPV